MKSGSLSGAMLLGLSAAIAAAAGAPSPARAQLEGFIAAFNTGERTKIETFARDHAPPDFIRAAVLDDTMKMFEVSGGFDVLGVTESGPHALKSRLRERRTNKIVELTIVVADAAPERITEILLRSPD